MKPLRRFAFLTAAFFFASSPFAYALVEHDLGEKLVYLRTTDIAADLKALEQKLAATPAVVLDLRTARADTPTARVLRGLLPPAKNAGIRLILIADRTDARIQELENKGHDMSGSLELLADARADIAAANDKITAVNQALATAMSQGTTTAKAQIPAVRAAVKAAEDALLTAKRDLIKTLESVKAEGGADAKAGAAAGN